MKKRIFLIVAFIIASVLILSNTKTKEVNAAEVCEKHYNYYLFLDATAKSWFDTEFASKTSTTRATSKYFELGIPEGATNVKEGQIEIRNEGTSWEAGKWFSLSYFYNSYNAIGPDSVDVLNDSTYATAIEWYNENGDTKTESTAIPVTYDEFKALVPTDFAVPAFSKTTIGQNSFNSMITRTWTSESISHISSAKVVFSPAVYYVSYDMCSEEEEEKYIIDVEFVDIDTGNHVIETKDSVTGEVESGTPYTYDCSNKKFDGYTLFTDENKPSKHSGIVTENKTLTCYYRKTTDNHNLIVEHLEEGTNEKIDADSNSGSIYKKGDKYQHQCKDIPGYEVTTNPSLLEGTFEEKDITRQCYYKKRVYTLTINYGEDEECINLLKESDSVDLKYKETYTYDKIPNTIGKLSSPKLGTYSSKFNEIPKLDGTNLTVTMPAKNVDVCIVYTPQTGSSWLYLVWVIGILSLGYSVWYFIRYYKKQNNEI